VPHTATSNETPDSPPHRQTSRYWAKTTLAHVFTAAALNLYRLDAWWTQTPLGTTRISHYEQLGLALTA
jgi:hypothetical protein